MFPTLCSCPSSASQAKWASLEYVWLFATISDAVFRQAMSMKLSFFVPFLSSRVSRCPSSYFNMISDMLRHCQCTSVLVGLRLSFCEFSSLRGHLRVPSFQSLFCVLDLAKCQYMYFSDYVFFPRFEYHLFAPNWWLHSFRTVSKRDRLFFSLKDTRFLVFSWTNLGFLWPDHWLDKSMLSRVTSCNYRNSTVPRLVTSLYDENLTTEYHVVFLIQTHRQRNRQWLRNHSGSVNTSRKKSLTTIYETWRAHPSLFQQTHVVRKEMTEDEAEPYRDVQAWPSDIGRRIRDDEPLCVDASEFAALRIGPRRPM